MTSRPCPPGGAQQAYPPSITGEPDREPGSSVHDHRFGAGAPFTVGVEEEYMLLDREDLDLVQHIDTVLASVSGHDLEPQITSELMQSVIEIATPVCASPADVETQLRRIRSYVCQVAAGHGLRVGSAGTHPFSLFERQQITAKERYRLLVDQLQYVARRELIFGLHVHVAVDDADKAVQVVNGLLNHTGELVALSASSPFWRGQPTGLASSRQLVTGAGPRSGQPPRFRDYRDYTELIRRLESTGCIPDYTHIWWDIRLHPRFGTVEIRVCDATSRLQDSVGLCAYCQALVKYYSDLYERRREIPSTHRILNAENRWLAARYGLDASLVDLARDTPDRIPARSLIERTMRQIEPHARELGSERELDAISDILAHGNGADRQLAIYETTHDLHAVVAHIAEAVEATARVPA